MQFKRDDRLFKALSWNDADYWIHAVARADDILDAIRDEAIAGGGTDAEQFDREVSAVEQIFRRFYGWVHSRKPEVARIMERPQLELVQDRVFSVLVEAADVESPVDPDPAI